MKEEFLHFIWQYKLFSFTNLHTSDNEKIEILRAGVPNKNEGPDFLVASIKIGDLIWNGNVEIHVNASDWEKHNHSQHQQYQNIILHIVYNNDKSIPSLINKNIPTLELKPYLSTSIIDTYKILHSTKNDFIPCEKLFIVNENSIDIKLFFEKLYIEKLEIIFTKMQENLHHAQQNWEAVLFHRMAYAFGLKINAECFLQIAQSVDFTLIKKIQKNKIQLEAFLLGKANLIKPLDEYSIVLQKEFLYLQKKYSTDNQYIEVNFLRLRPANFPTIRLSQLADLYFQYQNLFSFILTCKTLAEFYTLFSTISASEYWNTHYIIGKETKTNSIKKLTKNKIDLLLINAILPLKYAYQRTINKNTDSIFDILREIKPEQNSIIKKFSQLPIKAENALETQAIIELYTHYCSRKKCLDCTIGYKIMSTQK